MLTKIDLAAIGKLIRKETRKIIREEVEAEGKNIRDDLSSGITSSRIRIQTDIRDLQDRVKNLEIRTTSLDSKLTKMHGDLKREIRQVVNFLDKENLATLRLVKRIEDHLGLPTPSGF